MENDQAVAQPEKKQNEKKSPAAKPQKQGKPKKAAAATGSSVTASLRSSAGGATIFVEPEQTFYIPCVPEIIRFGARFDATMRSMSRRNPGHPAARVYFALFMWCMLAKFARVGIATSQIVLNAGQIPDASWVKLPPLLCGVIDSFGRFTDTVTKVSVAPRITLNLLDYLMTVLVSSLTPANVASACDPNNHLAYFRTCFGHSVHSQIIISDVLRNRGTSKRCTPDTLNDVNQAVASVIAEVGAANNGMGNAVSARLVTGVDIQDWYQANDTAPVQIRELMDAAQTQAFVASKDAVQILHVNAANPANNVAVQVVSSVFPTVGAIDVFSIKAHSCFIESLYSCRPPSFAPDGTPSPTITVSDAGYGFTASSAAQNVTVQDCIVGALLDQSRVFWVTPQNIVYALHAPNQVLRVQTTPFNTSVSSLLQQAFADGRKTGAY
jgi:hypothetical protein